jgi:hypothetical protein
MEIISKKILLEESIDRNFNSSTWGTLTATTFYLNIMLTQSMDNMGIFTDIEFFPKTDISAPPDYTILIEKLNSSGFTFPFMAGTQEIMNENSLTEEKTLRIPQKIESDYYNYLNLRISGYTDSKLEDVRSYNSSNPFRIGFDTDKDEYLNYQNVLINGISRVKEYDEPKKYVFDTIDDTNLGTVNQIAGLQYSDYSGQTRQVVIDGNIVRVPLTEFMYIGEGWNNTNTSLSAITKEEYLFGIISPPEVESDVFIDRGITSVTDRHLRLSEIKNLAQFNRYGNGLYKLNKQ